MSSRIVDRSKYWIPGLLAILLVSDPCFGLTDEALFRGLKLDFGTPGARTLGLGGSSAAVVDDATAFPTNPAALRDPGGIEFVGEFQSSSSRMAANSGQVGSGDVSAPVFPYVGAQVQSMPEFADGASFMGLVLPLNLGGRRASLGVSRHLTLDQQRDLRGANLDFALEDFPIWVNPNGDSGGPALEQYAVSSFSSGRLDAELVQYNVGMSLPLNSDFSVGATATVADLQVLSDLASSVEDPLGYLERPINPRADTDGDGVPDTIETRSIIDDGDTAMGYTLGVHYRPVSRFTGRRAPIDIGVAYSKGARLAVEQVLSETDPVTGLTKADPVTALPMQQTFMNTFVVPDRWRLGVAGHLGTGWLVTMDIERIEFADLLEDFDYGRDLLTSGLIDPEVLSQTASQSAAYDVDDATVVHLGGEYSRAFGPWSLAFRGGYFNEPDSRIRMTDFNSNSDSINAAFLATSEPEDDDHHVTAGFSVSSPRGLRFHLAADFADLTDRFLFSAAWRTGRAR